MKYTDEIIQNRLLTNYERFYRLAYSYVHNAADAQDIVQEGAYKALRAKSSLRRPEQIDTWLYRIMVNEAYSLLRKQSRRQELPELMDTGVYDNYEDFDLQTAIDRLPPVEATIIRLRFFEDLKLEQISEIMRMPLSTVKSKLYRTLKALQIELEE